MTRSRLTLALVATVGALLLAGCSSGAAPGSADSTPSAAPAESSATAVLLTISTENIAITNDDGSVASTFSYFDDPDKVVAALTEAFGFEPEIAEISPQREADEATADSVTWDEFVLVNKYAPAEKPYYVAFEVQTRASEIGGVSIETADGVVVGDDIDALSAKNPAKTGSYVNTATGVQYYDIRLAVKIFTNPLSGSHYVGVQGPVGGSVSFISAPNALSKAS